MLKLTNVEKSVPFEGGRLWLLRQINLEIAAGDFVSITGPSGSGKTTLLNILGLMDSDWAGEYELAGEKIHAIADKRRAALAREHVGFIFQHYHLLDDLSVYENLELPLTYRDIGRAERQSKVADILDRFGIVGKKDLFPSQLSGGQQQLVAVGRALITQPSVILADEPTGALHSSQGRTIMELLRELNEDGATIVQVTHNPDNAAYGRRIITLQDGWMQDEGAADDNHKTGT
ncbi:MAG TPA: ABC transporter ATP-binding protein [Gammaproteobacteria bacterium]